MRYCKLINGRLVYAPKKIVDGDTVTYNPPAEMLEELGWKPLVVEPMPEPREGYHWEPVYTEEEDDIRQSWIEVEDPPYEPTADELLDIILGGAE